MDFDGSALEAACKKWQLIHAVLSHGKGMLTPESYRDQSKGWLLELRRLEEDIRTSTRSGGNRNESQ
jgi:hypothetical protein